MVEGRTAVSYLVGGTAGTHLGWLALVKVVLEILAHLGAAERAAARLLGPHAEAGELRLAYSEEGRQVMGKSAG